MRTTRASTSLVAVVTAVLLGLLGLFGLTGCSDDPGAATDHNAADVAFVDAMIPHHEQALEMVSITEGRELDPEFTALVEEIRAAQQSELATMEQWQQEWASDPGDEDPDGDGGGAGAEADNGATATTPDGMSMGGATGGMMSSEQLANLAQAPDGSFRRLWLQSMIEHHQGALGMAEAEIAGGRASDAVELARSIRGAQQGEITRLQALLAG